MLAENDIVKICDFGLAKDCYKSDDYVKESDGPLPIKWMAIESIRDRVFNVQTDVWSYGIFLWELFSLGSAPYPEIEVDGKFLGYLMDGNRMDQPKYCPAYIFNNVICKCWDEEPTERPTFESLSVTIGNLLEGSIRQHYIDLNEQYSEINKIIWSNHEYLWLKKDESGGNYVNMKSVI